MKWRLFISLLFLFRINAIGQNLVPNPSFEDSITCPTNYSQLYNTAAWVMPANTGTASADYYHQCAMAVVGVPSNIAGYQNARTGVAYAGIYVYGDNVREYLQVQLTEPMVFDKVYEVEVSVSPAENFGRAVDRFGIHFSQTAISGTGSYFPLTTYTPQVENTVGNLLSDTVNWTTISGTYTAVGNEMYITIGNFVDDATTQTVVIGPFSSRAYYYVDDVSVILLDSIQDSVPPVNPPTTNEPKPSNSVWLPNIYSPNGDGENDVLYVRGNNIKELTFIVYNRWGEKVFESKDINYGWDGSYKGEMLNPAVFVYYAEGTYIDGNPFSKKGNVTLVR